MVTLVNALEKNIVQSETFKPHKNFDNLKNNHDHLRIKINK